MLYHFQRRMSKVVFVFDENNYLVDQSRSFFPFME